MKNTEKHILNQQELVECRRKAKKRLGFFIIGFLLLVAGTFLILLIPRPFNLYLILLDISNSMSGTMNGAEGESKVDIAKESVMKFVETCGSRDYFVLATFGPGNCGQKGLEWIKNNPGKCGGKILVSISNDKLQIYDEISKIQAENVNTHLSESLFKVFKFLDTSLADSPGFRKIEVLVVGDGQDSCHAIKAGDSVVLLPWTFIDKLRLNTIAVQVVDSENLQTLAADGNGEYVDVNNAGEFYKKIKVIFPIGPEWILFIHIALVVLFILLFALILKT